MNLQWQRAGPRSQLWQVVVGARDFSGRCKPTDRGCARNSLPFSISNVNRPGEAPNRFRVFQCYTATPQPANVFLAGLLALSFLALVGPMLFLSWSSDVALYTPSWQSVHLLLKLLPTSRSSGCLWATGQLVGFENRWTDGLRGASDSALWRGSHIFTNIFM